MKDLAKFALLAFALGLGGIVAYRMSAEAMAVIVGVVAGVLASVIVSAIVFVAVNRRNHVEREPRREYPPVVIVTGDARHLQPPRYGPDYGDAFGFPGLATPRRSRDDDFVIVDQAD